MPKQHGHAFQKAYTDRERIIISRLFLQIGKLTDIDVFAKN